MENQKKEKRGNVFKGGKHRSKYTDAINQVSLTFNPPSTSTPNPSVSSKPLTLVVPSWPPPSPSSSYLNLSTASEGNRRTLATKARDEVRVLKRKLEKVLRIKTQEPAQNKPTTSNLRTKSAEKRSQLDETINSLNREADLKIKERFVRKVITEEIRGDILAHLNYILMHPYFASYDDPIQQYIQENIEGNPQAMPFFFQPYQIHEYKAFSAMHQSIVEIEEREDDDWQDLDEIDIYKKSRKRGQRQSRISAMFPSIVGCTGRKRPTRPYKLPDIDIEIIFRRLKEKKAKNDSGAGSASNREH